jgi:hypothetical protein
VVAVAGHPKERSTFYFGSTGGGVWCTTDAGITWCNLSDGFFHRAAVGAIALAPSEPSVIYAGMKVLVSAISLLCPIGRAWSSDTLLRT